MEHAPARRWDFWAAVLLILALMTASRRLYVTDWTSGLQTVLLLTLLGAIVGLALGASKFKGLALSLLGLGYGLVLIPLVLAGLLYTGIAWLERMLSLGGQLAVTLGQLITRQPVEDPILFLTFVSVAFWTISLLAGYTLSRSGSFIGSVLPAGIALLIIQLFDMQADDRVYSLAIYAFLCLLLLGRLAYLARRQTWKEHRVWMPSGSGGDLTLLLGTTALALVLLAWIVPASGRPISAARIAWENMSRSWEIRRSLDRLITSLHGHQTRTPEFYGDTLSLGRQARTGEDVFLRIRVPAAYSEFRYYWRVRAYDFYEGGAWRTNDALARPLTPDETPLPVADTRGPSGRFTFSPRSIDLLTLVSPPHPTWVSRPATLTFIHAAGDEIDPLSFRATPSVLVGEQYAVLARIYEPTADELHDAGTDYPAWVSERYLQLPDDFPPEIVDQAAQIAGGLETPYEQANAITAYLRENITYSPTVESPPADRDPLLWFLFDTRTGFCNYYATAEVVLLRSLGIPARMVVGFAAGEFEEPDQYIVLEQDAHAWPEVYFPGIGWVEFEPTASQPPLVRLEAEDTSNGLVIAPTPEISAETPSPEQTPPPEIGGTAPTKTGLDASMRLTIALFAASLLIIASFLAYVFGAMDNLIEAIRRVFQNPLPVILKNSLESLALTPPHWLVRWAYLDGLAPAVRSFDVVYRSLHWLGEVVSPSQTPAEAAARLGQRLPAVSPEIRTLLRECQRSLYARRSGEAPIAHRAAKTIRRAAQRVVLQRRWKALTGKLTMKSSPGFQADR